MAAATLTLAGRRFVVLPEAEYRKLKAKAVTPVAARKTKRQRRPTKQELGDIAESKRRLANEGSVPLADVMKRLGL